MSRLLVLMLAIGCAAPSTVRAEDAVEAEVGASRDSPAPTKELAPIFRYPLLLRVHGGIGFAQRARQQDGISLAAMGGVQLMLAANENQSFGVEIDFIQADARPERRYVAAGLLVENRIDWFLLGIGSMAYVPLAEPRPTPVGITTKLGWVPSYHRVVNPFIVLRADWIFDDRIVGILSANAGIQLSLYSRRSKGTRSPLGAKAAGSWARSRR